MSKGCKQICHQRGYKNGKSAHCWPLEKFTLKPSWTTKTYISNYNLKCWQYQVFFRIWSSWNAHTLWKEWRKMQPLWKQLGSFLQSYAYTCYTTQQFNFWVGVYLTDVKTVLCKNTYINVYRSSITTTKMWKQAECSKQWKCKQTTEHSYCGIPLSDKKGQTIDTMTWMDFKGIMLVTKSVSRDYILYSMYKMLLKIQSYSDEQIWCCQVLKAGRYLGGDETILYPECGSGYLRVTSIKIH